jgi:hypothetical protein
MTQAEAMVYAAAFAGSTRDGQPLLEAKLAGWNAVLMLRAGYLSVMPDPEALLAEFRAFGQETKT